MSVGKYRKKTMVLYDVTFIDILKCTNGCRARQTPVTTLVSRMFKSFYECRKIQEEKIGFNVTFIDILKSGKHIRFTFTLL